MKQGSCLELRRQVALTIIQMRIRHRQRTSLFRVLGGKLTGSPAAIIDDSQVRPVRGGYRQTDLRPTELGCIMESCPAVVEIYSIDGYTEATQRGAVVRV
jgi:hypothetical protein